MRVCELRHSDDFAKSRIVISDQAQVLVSLVLDDVVGRRNERDVAIWTNSGDYAMTMLPMFSKAFDGGTDAREKLQEMKTAWDNWNTGMVAPLWGGGKKLKGAAGFGED